MDVIRDEAIVSLNQQNVKVLDVNLQASRDRFQVGDLTRTDVAQSDARLAVARSQLQTAQARLISSRENYIRLVGTPPGELEVPPELPNLPADPNAAVGVALRNNPTLLAAQKSRDASAYDIDVARAGRLPRVSVNVGGNYNNYLDSLGTSVGLPNSSTAGTVGVGLTVPLFQGGRPAAQVRQAQERRAQANEQVIETERGVISQARSAYAVWRSSLEVIASSEIAVNANKLSLEGVRAENSVGNRTILDILNAEQELLNSQVTAGDGATRRLCRRLRPARGDGRGGSARSRARRRAALRSGRQLSARAPQDLGFRLAARSGSGRHEHRWHASPGFGGDPAARSDPRYAGRPRS